MLTSNQSRIAVVRPYQSNLNEPNTSHTTALCSTNSIQSIKQISAEANTERQANVFADSTSELQVRYPMWCTGAFYQHRSVSNWCKKTAMPKLRAQMPNYD